MRYNGLGKRDLKPKQHDMIADTCSIASMCFQHRVGRYSAVGAGRESEEEEATSAEGAERCRVGGIDMAYALMTYAVMAYVVTAYIVMVQKALNVVESEVGTCQASLSQRAFPGGPFMAYIVMTYVVMAYIVSGCSFFGFSFRCYCLEFEQDRRANGMLHFSSHVRSIGRIRA